MNGQVTDRSHISSMMGFLNFLSVKYFRLEIMEVHIFCDMALSDVALKILGDFYLNMTILSIC